MKRNVYVALVPVLGIALALASAAAAAPGHGYLSVAAGSFHPAASTCEWLNEGSYVRTFPAGACVFRAAVQLPQGATVTKLTATWNDWAPEDDGTAGLMRVSNQTPHNEETVVELSTFGPVYTNTTTYTTTVLYNPIDNSQWAYYAYWDMPTHVVWGRNIVIEYTYQSSLPAILRNFQSSLRGR